MKGALEEPMFSVCLLMQRSFDTYLTLTQISLQRDMIDPSGKGVLSIGKLPEGVDNSSLTWVPVRLYTADEGGISPPTFAPNEVHY